MTTVKSRRENLLETRQGLEESLRVVSGELFALDSDVFFEMALNVLVGVIAHHSNTKGDLKNSVGWDIRNEFHNQLRRSLEDWYKRRGK
jgi:hypothetical protein